MKAAGIKELAATVGVSIGTVDRALHARPGISEATHARIMKAAAALGYIPNLVARHLKLGRQPQQHSRTGRVYRRFRFVDRVFYSDLHLPHTDTTARDRRHLLALLDTRCADNWLNDQTLRPRIISGQLG